MRNERGEVTTDTTELQRIVRKYHEQLYANTLDNLEETDKLLDTYNLLRLNQEKTENLNTPITTNEINLVIEKLPKKQIL